MITGWADGIVVPLTAMCEEDDPEAQRWIMHVVLNRATLNPVRYGSTPAAVCFKREQFSEFLPDAADNADLERVAGLAADSANAQAAIQLYAQVLSEPDPTSNSTGFYAASAPEPDWAKVSTFVAQVGSTKFYSNVP